MADETWKYKKLQRANGETIPQGYDFTKSDWDAVAIENNKQLTKDKDVKTELELIKATQDEIITALQSTNDSLLATNNHLTSVITDGRLQSDTQVTGSNVEKTLGYLERIANDGKYPDDYSDSPGSKFLQVGDYDAGFYGFVQPHEFGQIAEKEFNGSNLALEIGLSQGTVQFDNTPWMKFSWNRKILFIPLKPIRHSESWDSIYKSGAVYGTGSTISDGEQFMLDNDPNYGTGARVSQNARVTIGGLEYKVRLMKGAGNDPTDSYANSDRGSDGAKNEWNSLILPLHHKAPSGFAYNAYADTPRPDWGVGLTDAELMTRYTLGTGSYSWMQETRDTVEGDEDGLVRRVHRGYDGASTLGATPSSHVHSGRGFRPVLELL